MSSANKKTSLYDYVVVGSGLAGLCVANALSRAGSSILLIEAADAPGGLNHPVKTRFGDLDNGLRFYPDTELANSGLRFLSALMGEEAGGDTVASEPVTYEAGGLRPFVGFGNQSPEFYDQLAAYLNPRERQLRLPVHEWTTRLFAGFQGEFWPRSYVTKFHFADGKIHSLTINGQKVIQALNVIYAGPLKSLRILLPSEALSAKSRQKLGKSQYWTLVGIDITHAQPVTTESTMHVLNGTTQDDLGPCAGRFLPTTEGIEGQISQWVTFIDDEDAEDTEKIGAALKKVKRQIKRAYPESLEGSVSERILVVPSFAGHGDLKLTASQTLTSANNFWVASGAIHPQPNLVGTLAQAQLVTSALGVHPLTGDFAAPTEMKIESAQIPENPDDAGAEPSD